MVTIYGMYPKNEPTKLIYVGRTKRALGKRASDHRWSWNGGMEFVIWKKSNEFVLRAFFQVPEELAKSAESTVIKAALEAGYCLYNSYLP